MGKRLFIAALLLIGQAAGADLLRVPFEAVRPLGMGNAFVAIADDSNALFYNPAGLSWVKGLHFNLIDMIVGFDNLDTLRRMGSTLKHGDFNQLIRTDDTQFIRLGLKPTFVMPYFGIAIYNNLQGFFDFRNLQAADVDVFAANDLGVTLGFSLPVSPFASIGASIKALHRTAVDVHLTPADFLAQVGLGATDFQAAAYSALENQVGTGYAFGLSLGGLAKIPLGKKGPTIQVGATVEDVTDTNFRPIGTTPVPRPIPVSYNLGTALLYPVAKDTQLNVALDLRDNFRDLPFFKQAHLGLELRHKLFAFRGGLYQGYPTYGVSIEAPHHTRIHFSSHAVELDNFLWTRAQRIYQVQIVVGFNPF